MENENTLLDLVAEKIGARNDAQLARGLEVAPPVISKIRHNRLPVGAALIIKIHERTGMPVAEIKSYLTNGMQAPREAGKSPVFAVKYGVQRVAK